MSFYPLRSLKASPNPSAGFESHFEARERERKREGREGKERDGRDGRKYPPSPGNNFLVTALRASHAIRFVM